MYCARSSPSEGMPTLISTASLFCILFTFILQASPVASRNVHNQLLYTRFTPPLSSLFFGDHSQPEIDDLLEDWASIQRLLDQQPTPSRQHSNIKATPSISLSSSSVISPTPTAADIRLFRRDTFSTNVCPIGVQTTVYISVDSTSTVTLSSTVGPRPTGIPGDAGTSTGTDPTGGSTGPRSTSGQSVGNREGLIAGIAIVVIILLASFCALCFYFYKKRRNARIARLSVQPGVDPAEMVRRMGTKGFMNISAQGRNLTRLWRRPRIQIQAWSPVAFFGRAIRRLKSATKRDDQRDSQSSELLEWKQRSNYPWSEAEVPVFDAAHAEKPLSSRPSTQQRKSPSPIPETVPSPKLPEAHLSVPPKPAARPSSGEPNTIGFVPLVQRRVSSQPSAERLPAVGPIAIEPVRLESNPDLTRQPSTRRVSTGEPLSPSAWMAGFGLASASNIDPFNNPSYVSSSDHHTSISGHSASRISEDPMSPRSVAHSLGSDRTTRGRQRSPQRTTIEPLSTVSENNDVRLDGASDIMSTLGSTFHDRSESRHSLNETNDPNTLGEPAQAVYYHPLSDVEEVLTPVADERLSMQPPWRSTESHSSSSSKQPRIPSLNSTQNLSEPPSPNAAEYSSFRNPFADSSVPAPMSIPFITRMRLPGPPRKISEPTSLSGSVYPSEKSGSISLAGTSIVDHSVPIDADWDRDSIRIKESEQIFYRAGGSSGSGSAPSPQNNR